MGVYITMKNIVIIATGGTIAGMWQNWRKCLISGRYNQCRKQIVDSIPQIDTLANLTI